MASTAQVAAAGTRSRPPRKPKPAMATMLPGRSKLSVAVFLIPPLLLYWQCSCRLFSHCS